MIRLLPRIIAGTLSIWGLFWAVILAFFAASGGAFGGFVAGFGFGCLVWIGWIVRALMRPELPVRITIWVASILYHSIWLFRLFGSSGGGVVEYWYIFIILLSITALSLEKFAVPNHSPDPTPASGTPAAGQPPRHP
jgi:hypothetical protein